MSDVPAVPWHRAMSGRDPQESHRSATPLELFFDLCFVVAVAAAAETLHHDVAHGHLSGLVGYAMVFFAIWWAWMNYSWFASAYDTDDVTFRLLTFVVMAGVLVVAAGVPSAAGEEHDFWILVAGYVIMRVAMIPLWLRVSREHPQLRRTALRYAGSIAVSQVLWVLRTMFLAEGTIGLVSFAAMAILEMAGPWWAERPAMTPWHRHHIAERYELFTIIVLGEVILATTRAISESVDEHGLETQLLLLVVGALLMVFSMWWIYFKRPVVDSVTRRTAFVFGYSHYLVFGSIAAVGASLAVLVDVVEHAAHVEPRTGMFLLVSSLTVYLLLIVGVHALAGDGGPSAIPVLVVVVVSWLVALLGLAPGTSVLLVGLVVAASVGDHIRRTNRAASAQGQVRA